MFRNRKIINRDIAFVARRLGERMVAGRMAIPFFRQAGQAEATNVERRRGRRAARVINLAAAAAHIGQQIGKSGQTVDLESFLLNREFIGAVVHLTELLIAKDPKFPVKAEQLIRFRLS